MHVPIYASFIIAPYDNHISMQVKGIEDSEHQTWLTGERVNAG
jgi:hypothetical protein